jgi:hypothetical protein
MWMRVMGRLQTKKALKHAAPGPGQISRTLWYFVPALSLLDNDDHDPARSPRRANGDRQYGENK